jgi:hypothetical protein
MSDYTQCDLSRGNEHSTAWIPSEFAVVGAMLRIRVDGSWLDGFEVRKTYSTADKERMIQQHGTLKRFGQVLDSDLTRP